MFTKKYEAYLREGLVKTALKDKCTFAKDPFLFGRIGGTSLLTFLYLSDILIIGGIPTFTIGNLGILYVVNNLIRERAMQVFEQAKKGETEIGPIFSRFLTFSRRTVRNTVEAFDFPFEFDRLLLSLGYLQYQRLRGNPLIRASS